MCMAPRANVQVPVVAAWAASADCGGVPSSAITLRPWPVPNESCSSVPALSDMDPESVNGPTPLGRSLARDGGMPSPVTRALHDDGGADLQRE